MRSLPQCVCQPPLTQDDPRLQAFLSVTFDVLYDLNVQTGAIYFGEQIDHMLGLPAGRGTAEQTR